MRNSMDKANGGNKKAKASKNKYIVLFIAIVLLSGWIGLLVDMAIPNQPDEQTLGMGIWLVLPFLSGIAIRFFKRDWKDFGIRPRLRENIRWFVLALLIFPVVTLIFTLIAWSFGLATISSFSTLSLAPIIASLFVGLFIKNIFEDFAWQEFLWRRLFSTNQTAVRIQVAFRW